MKNRLLPPAWLVFSVACLWWFGVFVFDVISNQPHPRLTEQWLDWRKMLPIYRTGPFVAGAFAVLAAWALTLRVRSSGNPPSWFAWVCGTTALSWTGLVLWRAHDQAFRCAAFEYEFGRISQCWMSNILQSAMWWLIIPLAAWLIVAASSGTRSRNA